ncbi:MAG: hypothetical protein Q7T63_22040 [Burkholderiaceae bacterium]|nr:hypothetical protein [Burkholderiaceae bacterium]MDO9089083.1 hypothetical protein [Burkholderiaceae bacterium]
MNKAVFLTPLAALIGAFGATAHSEELGRVISSTPVMQQVAVPQQVCGPEQGIINQPSSGAGALIGGIAGGAMGNAVGGGAGRAAATMIGILGGAVIGDRIEGSSGGYVQQIQRCNVQTSYENRVVAYNVTYEYAGKQYSAQMPNDPGQYLRIQVTPVGMVPSPADAGRTAAAPPIGYPQQAYGQPPYGQPTYVQPAYGQPTYVQPGVILASPPVVYAPYPYYARPYFPPIGVSLNLGFSRGYHRSGLRGGHTRGWR